MSKYSISVLIICLACCNNKRESDIGTSTIAMSSEDSSSIFSNVFSQWIDSTLNVKSANQKLAVEERWVDDSLKAEPFAPGSHFYTTYAAFLRWSPDSSNILDIGSYGMVPVKDKSGNIQLEGGEPDTEVALISHPRQERTRLLFVGPSATIIDGRWLSNTEAVIVGTFSNPGKTDTLMWMIDFQEKLFRLYNFNSANK
jgi:hypothetical protein